MDVDLRAEKDALLGVVARGPAAMPSASRRASTVSLDEVGERKKARTGSVSSDTFSAPSGWHASTWRAKPIKQQPDYKCKVATAKARAKLSALPPLVTANEVMDLRRQLEEVAAGERFIIQGGDCAERFDDCTSHAVETKLRLLFQMGVILVWGSRIPVTRIGRIAGQYHKPRSKPTEKHGDGEVMCYKGDAINGFEIEERDHDPDRLVLGYFHSAATLNYIRCLIDSGFADVARYHPKEWDLSFVTDPALKRRYNNVAKDISHAFEFMASCVTDKSVRVEGDNQLFTSHEGLVLDFEESMTREVDGKHFNLGAHMVWIGDRTRQLDGAHIEYFRGISNPVGCKCGPTTIPSELIELVTAINPDNVSGKVILISRFGAGKVDKLREIILEVKAAGLNVVWQCDPMHGNTFSTAAGIKTRSFDDVLSEVLETFKAHEECGTWLGGVHLEMTGDDHITECVGGSCGVSDTDLHTAYESQCDPRLNGQQSLEMALQLVDALKASRLAKRSESP